MLMITDYCNLYSIYPQFQGCKNPLGVLLFRPNIFKIFQIDKHLIIKPYFDNLIYLNFQPLEVVFRYLECLKITHICLIWE